MYAVLFTLIALAADVANTYSWELPKGFPPPRVPAGNPMTAAQVLTFGRSFSDILRIASISMKALAARLRLGRATR